MFSCLLRSLGVKNFFSHFGHPNLRSCGGLADLMAMMVYEVVVVVVVKYVDGGGDVGAPSVVVDVSPFVGWLAAWRLLLRLAFLKPHCAFRLVARLATILVP